jgi:hypothetical protein
MDSRPGRRRQLSSTSSNRAPPRRGTRSEVVTALAAPARAATGALPRPPRSIHLARSTPHPCGVRGREGARRLRRRRRWLNEQYLRPLPGEAEDELNAEMRSLFAAPRTTPAPVG